MKTTKLKKGNEYLSEIPYIWRKIDGNTGYRTTEIVKTTYGYRIKRFSNYVSLLTIRLMVFPNGFSKATVKVDTNYRPKYQYTVYFDTENKEVKTRKEWLSMQ